MGIIMARTTMNLNYNDGSYLQGHPVHPTDYISNLIVQEVRFPSVRQMDLSECDDSCHRMRNREQFALHSRSPREGR